MFLNACRLSSKSSSRTNLNQVKKILIPKMYHNVPKNNTNILIQSGWKHLPRAALFVNHSWQEPIPGTEAWGIIYGKARKKTFGLKAKK